MRSLRREKREEGFSLVELIVVVLVIAILIAIAVPTFLGARNQAADRAVQSSIRNAFAATRIYYNDKLAYTADVTEMRAIEPTVQWTTSQVSESTPRQAVSIDIADAGQTVLLVGRAQDGRCFYLRDVMGSGAGTYYDRKESAGSPCADPTSIATWSTAWSTG